MALIPTEASPTARSRPCPTAPATARSTSGSPSPRTTSTGESAACSRPVAWLVTTRVTSRTAGCALAGSAMAKAGLLRSISAGRAGKGHAPDAEAGEEPVARSVVVEEHQATAGAHEGGELVGVDEVDRDERG